MIGKPNFGAYHTFDGKEICIRMDAIIAYKDTCADYTTVYLQGGAVIEITAGMDELDNDVEQL